MPQTTTYKPTFLQKLLGSNYKWWFIILYNLKSQRAYLGDTFFWTLSSFVRTAGVFGIWWLTTKDSPNFETNLILSYLFFGSFLSTMTNNWADLSLGWHNITGRISGYLLKPTSYLWYQYIMYIGRQFLANFPIQILSFVLLFPFIRQYLIFNLDLNLVFVILLIPIIYSLNLFLNFTFGCLTFWILELDGANDFYSYLSDFLKGGLIPLSMILGYFPFLNYSPFVFLLHHPMQIYLGKYSSLEIFYVFLGGIIWCAALYFLAKWVFKMGLKKNESVGL